MYVSGRDPLSHRLRVFRDAGLLEQVPTPWQIRQGEIEMTPYVLSTDATAEEGYRRSPLAHPLVRQPLVFSQVGLDHLRTGSALGARLESLCTHLALTFHRGMPVFDLQAVQTHEGGLDRLRTAIEDVRHGFTRAGRRRRRIARLLLVDPDGYCDAFLGDRGWIARAAGFDYDDAATAGSAFPPEFFSLVGFLDHCARSYPAERPAAGAGARLGALARAGRRVREGRGMGWFARPGVSR